MPSPYDDVPHVHPEGTTIALHWVGDAGSSIVPVGQLLYWQPPTVSGVAQSESTTPQPQSQPSSPPRCEGSQLPVIGVGPSGAPSVIEPPSLVWPPSGAVCPDVPSHAISTRKPRQNTRCESRTFFTPP